MRPDLGALVLKFLHGWTFVVLCGALLASANARGESQVRIAIPTEFGETAVDTYDAAGSRRVGTGFISFETLEDGTIQFIGRSAIQGAESTRINALFEAVPKTGQMRPLLQQSRSLDARGKPMGVMTIDHRKGVGTCAPTGETPRSVALPSDDRVANVILANMLRPLAENRSGEVPFQILICRPGVRVVSARARVIEKRGAPAKPAPASRSGEPALDLVEIETGADLGPILNRLLGPWLPTVSLWFDGTQSTWLGHRVPLFAKGPTVTVLRADIAERLAPQIQVP